MVKNLVNKFKNGTKRARKFTSALGLGTLLLFNSCIFNNCKPVVGPDFYTVTASLSVSPESGKAPLTVTYSVTGSPADKIETYVLTIKGPDSSGYSASLNSIASRGINSPLPYKTIGKTRINNNSPSEIANSGVQSPIKIKRSSNAKTKGLEEFIKGNSEISSQISKKAEVESFYKNSQGEILLEFEEISTESKGNIQNYPVYRNVATLQDINEEIISYSPINIERVYNNMGLENLVINVNAWVIDQEGRDSSIVSKTLTINPQNRDVRLSGILRNNETDSVVAGMLKVFDSNHNLINTDSSNEQGYVLTESSGRFDFTAKNADSTSGEIIIRAAHGTPGNQQSWVRTKSIPAVNTSNLDIVAVPYGEFSTNPDEFRNFMYEVTYDGYPGIFDYEGFDRGFIILKENLDDSIDSGKPEGKGKFSDEQINYLKHIITPDVEKVERVVNTSNYSINVESTSENYFPGAGVIYIIPSTAPGGNSHYGGLYVPTAGLDGFTQGADIYLKDSLSSDEWELKATTLHEIGHVLYSHSTNPNSRMCGGGPLYYTSLDLKGMNLIYEKAFIRPDWNYGDESPVQHLRYILGRDFDDWDW